MQIYLVKLTLPSVNRSNDIKPYEDDHGTACGPCAGRDMKDTQEIAYPIFIVPPPEWNDWTCRDNANEAFNDIQIMRLRCVLHGRTARHYYSHYGSARLYIGLRRRV